MTTQLPAAHRVASMGVAVLRAWVKEPSAIAGFSCYRRYLDAQPDVVVVVVVNGLGMYAADAPLATDYPDQYAEMVAAPWWWIPPDSSLDIRNRARTALGAASLAADRFATAEEAMADADRALVAQGWVLL